MLVSKTPPPKWLGVKFEKRTSYSQKDTELYELVKPSEGQMVDCPSTVESKEGVQRM